MQQRPASKQPVRSAARATSSPRAPGAEVVSAGERLRRAWLRHPVTNFFRQRSVIAFYRQLHSMVRAGIPLPTAFGQLVQYAPDATMRRALEQVALAVQGGATLAEAMRANSASFDDANVELIAFAEEAGRLEPVIETLLEHLEKMQALRWQAVMSALWPMYLAGALVFVGPLLGVAQTIKPGQSAGTLYVAGLGSSLSTVFTIATVVLGVPFLISLAGLEVEWDRFKRSLPLISVPLRSLAASRLVLGLGLANASGLEIVRSLRLAVKATGSPSLVRGLPGVEALVQRGSTLTEAIASLGLLDRPTLGALAVAETTGTLSTALERVSHELQESSLRATRFLMLFVVGLFAVVMLVKIVIALTATLFGPVKTLYDAAGSGSLDRN